MNTKNLLIPVLATFILNGCNTISPEPTPTPPQTKMPATKNKTVEQTKPSLAETADPYFKETKQQRDARMQWWREARFGMFIHWGVYSTAAGFYEGQPVPGYGEWIMNKGKIPIDKYKAFAKDFNPTKYDADAWVRLAKQAGMKYIVITAKHHDGFALFPSAASDWNIKLTPYGKDLLQPLAEACRKHGIKLGFYYSQAQDWINEGACSPDPNKKRTMDQYIDEIAVPQVRELLTNYGEFPSILWWDTPAAMNEERAAKLVELLKLKPGIIHNNRVLKVAPCGIVDFDALKSGKKEPFSGDTDTPEQHIPATGLGDRDWEGCMTINHTWGYKSDDDSWKSTTELLRNLIDIASKGGNYLLNIGPTGEGLVPQPTIERLQEMGKWMDLNGESIYGTTASPFEKLAWGRCTTKKHENGTTLYLHVFDWPKDGKLLIPGLQNTVKSAKLLVSDTKVKSEKTPNGIVLDVPAEAPDAIASVIKMEISGKPKVVQIFIKPAADGSLTLPAQLVDIGIPKQGSAPNLQQSADGLEIGGWTNPEASVSWAFSALKAGDYEVLAEISGLENAKATLELGKATPSVQVDISGIQKAETTSKTGTEGLPVNLAATGDYHTFQTQNLGKLHVAGSGDQQLTLRPDPEAWKPFNLRKITLRPVAK